MEPAEPKIRSALVEGAGARDLKRKYEEIYASSDVWLYRKSQGVHTVIFSLIEDLLPGARALDAGCGAGRLSLMCATRATAVVGVDFSEGAIAIASLCADACDVKNTSFVCEDLTRFSDPEPFDLVTLIGTLEHVPDPVESLRDLNRHLRPGGIAVVSCPNFLNFRGHTYMTLLTLFDLPMSLADVRQVAYWDIRAWAARTGFEHVASAGAIYRFAWDRKSIEDMIRRVPAALRDRDLGVTVDLPRYNAWLESMEEPNRAALEWLERQGVLRRIERRVTLSPRRPNGVDDDLWGRIQEYLCEDIEADPYWSDVEPLCFQGGEGIYLLRKSASL